MLVWSGNVTNNFITAQLHQKIQFECCFAFKILVSFVELVERSQDLKGMTIRSWVEPGP